MIIKDRYFGVDARVAEPYIKSLESHIAYVNEAGRRIGVDPVQLKAHDLSKWTEAEFPAYANRFYGEPDEQAFKQAWLHHVHNNPHHWNHWLLNSDNGGFEALEMPRKYALEMVADWMGASKAYTGSWDMKKWLGDHFQKMILHPKTRDYVIQILIDNGYTYELLSTPTAVEVA